MKIDFTYAIGTIAEGIGCLLLMIGIVLIIWAATGFPGLG